MSSNETRIDLAKFSFLRYMSRDGNLMRLVLITAAIFALMSILSPDRFLTFDNFDSMAYQFPEFGILSLAMMITMLTGGIDLSIVGIANLSGVFAALMMLHTIPDGASTSQILTGIMAAVLLAMATGAGCGFINGLLIAKINIPPILATLGTMQFFTGIAIVVTKGYAIFGLPDQFSFIGNEAIGIFPVPFLIFAAFAWLFSLLLNKTGYGTKLYMMGTNATAAKFSGINNTMMLVKTYMLSGLVAALAGLVIVARTNSAKADYGTSYTLQAILIAVMGGVNPNGGFGTIAGIVLAVLTLQFLSSGFNMLGFSNFFKDFIWGAVLIFIMVVNFIFNNRRAKRRK